MSFNFDSKSRDMADWFGPPASVAFWHASVRLTLDGESHYLHAGFGPEKHLCCFEANIAEHFLKFPSQINAHEDDEKEFDFGLSARGRKGKPCGHPHRRDWREFLAKFTKILGPSSPGVCSVSVLESEMLRGNPENKEDNDRDDDYYGRIVSSFPSLGGKKGFGFFVTKNTENHSMGDQSGFSVVAIYVPADGNNHNAKVMMKAIDFLAMELLAMARDKSILLAEAVKRKETEARIYERLVVPFGKLRDAASNIMEFYAAMRTELLGPGAPLWDETSPNRTLLRYLADDKDLSAPDRSAAMKWLMEISATLKPMHDALAVSASNYNENDKELHAHVMILLWAGIDSCKVKAIPLSLLRDAPAFLKAYKDLAAFAFVKHFFECEKCRNLSQMAELFRAQVFHSGQYSLSKAQVSEWLGMQLLAAGFDVCPQKQNLFSFATEDNTRASLESGFKGMIESVALVLTNIISSEVGNRCQFSKFLAGSDNNSFVIEFTDTESKLKPLKESSISEDLQKDLLGKRRFFSAVSRNNGITSLTVNWE